MEAVSVEKGGEGRAMAAMPADTGKDMMVGFGGGGTLGGGGGGVWAKENGTYCTVPGE
jgi:hypothetical protein